MIVLQINSNANTCSHGRIAEDIGKLLIKNHHQSYIAYGRTKSECQSTLIRTGNKADLALHLAKTRLFDRHGFGSARATRNLVKKIEDINPDIVHLHNIHGYYINIEILFKYLKSTNKPVVWTLHDCWPFTGHCAHFQHLNCYKWESLCFECPNPRGYPKSCYIDNSKRNYRDKSRIFGGLDNITLVSPSVWLAENLKRSFLKKYTITRISNGIDIDVFRPRQAGSLKSKYTLNRKYILGVANIWSKSKGIDDIKNLREILDPDIGIVLVGLTHRQIDGLPAGIKGFPRTASIEELASFYSGAECFINPTYADNLPTTNLEALACGTPVVTYDTGGSTETISADCGFTVRKGEIHDFLEAVMKIIKKGKSAFSPHCRRRAVDLFDKNLRYNDYLELYTGLLQK